MRCHTTECFLCINLLVSVICETDMKFIFDLESVCYREFWIMSDDLCCINSIMFIKCENMQLILVHYVVVNDHSFDVVGQATRNASGPQIPAPIIPTHPLQQTASELR